MLSKFMREISPSHSSAIISNGPILVVQALFESNTELVVSTELKFPVAMEANGVNLPANANAPLIRGDDVVVKLDAQTAKSTQVSIIVRDICIVLHKHNRSLLGHRFSSDLEMICCYLR